MDEADAVAIETKAMQTTKKVFMFLALFFFSRDDKADAGDQEFIYPFFELTFIMKN